MDRQDVGTAQVIRGNALDLPLADGSVDLVVTSPPYFGLRSYQDGGEHYAGQIGDEATPAEFVESLLEVTRECVRVLKPSGSLWVNLGDKYSRGKTGPDNVALGSRGAEFIATRQHRARGAEDSGGVPTKSLIGIPWRYALRCIDDLGLILRAEVIWSKPNGLPESVTDRVRRSHETWFHFTKEPRYFSAVDEIREEHNSVSWIGREKQERANSDRNDGGKMANTANPLGKLPGSVWTIPTQPLRVPERLGIDHFAAFPMEWPRRIIRGWSPAGVCVECGEGRRPTMLREFHGEHNKAEGQRQRERVGTMGGGTESVTHGRTDSIVRSITGYACACPEPTAPTTPATVLDPFGGTGTTALVAKALGRHGISVDMSADYCRLAEWRTNDEGELARAMQVEKPAKQVDGQTSLLDLIEEPA